MDENKKVTAIYPMDDRIYLFAEKLRDKTDSGLYLPDQREQRVRLATIRKCGEKATKFKEGETVLISSFTGTPIMHLNEGTDITDDRHRICRQDEIIAKVDVE
jgi:co-chaperonin GroES (HSP10)